jgi:glutathione S-transferase
MSQPRLLTFPPSSNCEVGRWILNHYGVSFHEQAEAAPFFILYTGTKGKIPQYFLDDKKYNGPEAMIDYYESIVPIEQMLVPKEHKTEIDQFWQDYNITMGNQTVVWAYTYLLPHKDIMVRPLSLNSPWIQRMIVRYCYWLPKVALWKAAKLGEPQATQALKILQDSFKTIDGLLADGRQYLVNNQFSLADIAFSVSGAPLVLPQGYGGAEHEQGPIPTYEQYPDNMKKIVDEMRETPSGKFILRMYAEHRYKK